ncbi:hypothetical protein [Oceanithermus sp.]
MRFGLGVLLTLLILAGCSSPGTRLSVAPETAELEPGGTLELVAEGLPGDTLVWEAAYGTLAGTGTSRLYRAPDFPADDRVIVYSQTDPRLRAEVRIAVRSARRLRPRVEIAGDLALIFTREGEERLVEALVYDAAGNPIPEAELRFTSEDPQAFAVEPSGPRSARVRALTQEATSARIFVRYGDLETWAYAVRARLQPDAVQLEDADLLEATWDPQAQAWTRVLLRRTGATEALSEGQVVFSGDRTGVWGRILRAEPDGDRIALELGPAALEEVFAELDYRARAPGFAARARLGTAGLRLSSVGGAERLVPLGPCEAGDAPELEEFEATLRIQSEARLRVHEGKLEDFTLAFDPETRHTLGPVRLEFSGEDELHCMLASWGADAPPLSLLLFTLRPHSAFELEVGASSSTPVEATLPQLSFARALHLGSGQEEALVAADGFDPETAGVRLDSAGELDARLRLRARFEARASGEADPPDLEQQVERAFVLTLTLPEPAAIEDPDYAGPRWEMGWLASQPRTRPPSAGRLKALVPTQPTATDAPLPTHEPALLHNPRVWSYLTTGASHQVDLGNSGGDDLPHLNFGADPDLTGAAEVWVRPCMPGQGCAQTLRKLGSTPKGEPFIWWPEKRDRGVYEVFVRHRLGPLGRDLPYASQPPDPWLVVRTPDLTELPLVLELRGPPGGTAEGVLEYANPSARAAGPGNEEVELTSPLRVTLQPSGNLSASPRTLTTAAGMRGRHLLQAPCPETGGEREEALELFSNDPEWPQVELPVHVVCDAGPNPAAHLSARPPGGPAPLAVSIAFGVEAADLTSSCQLDFGDGSPPFAWSAGSCPKAGELVHDYPQPGRYTLSLVVADGTGPRTLAQYTIEVK